MQGIGPPLVTPFDEHGDVDYDRLTDLVGRLEREGVDFLVPCGSTSEAPLLTPEERTRVIETTAEVASVPVLAGTGAPGLRQTRAWTEAAAEAGAVGALVVTPFYYNHSQDDLAGYYRDLADGASIPIYLYSVPVFAKTRLDPETAGSLAEHPNIVGMKDSAGDLGAFVRTLDRVEESFDLLVGDASVLAQALDAGASGGIAALANLYPDRLSALVETHSDDPEFARERNRSLVSINRAVTTEHGIPGLKYAMRQRGFPAGYARRPHTEPSESARADITDRMEQLP
ncbi:dihydrodipicolinate synthase family protein [Halovenus sp. WSH3]|uniref:Dihydrodipicolinate synthase family protein n=1 Tax=Halovenus carboxidivorans TaxID=2692199 RepID=A0A6B0SXU8_9EURY|nr:dihydrodipicolinate synthase family protein [Halovenus carboxidivorans]MXR50175.1 dihydrodipicolinate synthase family protein [Halovenus carboxidivorans]